MTTKTKSIILPVALLLCASSSSCGTRGSAQSSTLSVPHAPLAGQALPSSTPTGQAILSAATAWLDVYIDSGDIMGVRATTPTSRSPGNRLSDWLLAGWVVRLVSSAPGRADRIQVVVDLVTSSALDRAWLDVYVETGDIMGVRAAAASTHPQGRPLSAWFVAGWRVQHMYWSTARADRLQLFLSKDLKGSGDSALLDVIVDNGEIRGVRASTLGNKPNPGRLLSDWLKAGWVIEQMTSTTSSGDRLQMIVLHP